MELAIINGTYRDSNTKALAAAGNIFYLFTLSEFYILIRTVMIVVILNVWCLSINSFNDCSIKIKKLDIGV